MDKGSFSLVGFREVAAGILNGPFPVAKAPTFSRARELSLAVLWFEKEKWCSISIHDKTGLELVTFRRFPPGRQRIYSDEEVKVEVRKKMGGANLAIGPNGHKRRCF
jgi:hypothetical protein